MSAILPAILSPLGASRATAQRVIWLADFAAVTPGAASEPAGVPYTRASAATTIHPLVASMSASGFATDAARIVTTTGGAVGLFLEGTATNGHASDTPWDAATWAGAPSGGSSTTQDASTLDPAGVAGCALHAVLSGGYSRHDSAATHFAASILGQLVTAHCYAKGTASATWASNAYDGAVGHGATSTLTGGWDHVVNTYTAAARTRSIVYADGRDTATMGGTSAGGGAAAGARNFRTARHMIQTGPRASSWIAPTTTRAGARCRLADLADVVRDGRLCLELSFVAPYASSSLPWSPRLWTIDASNYAEIDMLARCIRVVVDGVAAWVSAPITWSRGDVVVLRLDVGNGPTTGTVQVAGGRVCAINDGRTLAALPASGTIDLACNGTASQLEGVHTRWRAFAASPSYKTITVATTAALLSALGGGGRNRRILLREGTYRLTETLALTAAHSGLAIANYPGETATIDGGEVVSGTWSPADGDGVRSIAFGGHSLQLWVDGVACVRARSGFDPVGWTWNGDGTVTAPSGAEAARVGVDGWIVARRLWRTFRMRVASIVGAVITLNADDYADAITLDPSFSPNAVWFVEGLGFVGDADGYFWHSRATGTLYVTPRTGQDLDTDEVIAGKLERILTATGTLDAPARDITISGIGLAHTTWTDPDDHGSVALQGSVLVRANGGDENASGYAKMTGGIMAWAAHRFVITGCVIEGLGGDGVSLRHGSQSCAVLDNAIGDIGGTALSSGNVTSFVEDPHPSDARAILGENVFANNAITNVAQWNPSSHAVWAVANRGLVVARNRIGPTSYTPIAIGWGWGAWDLGGVVYLGSPSGWPLGITPAPTSETFAGASLIANNWIEGYLEALDDGGAIYTIGDLGNGGRTTIVGNYVVESSAAPNQAAFYLDQGSEHIVVRGNVAASQSVRWLNTQGSVTPYAREIEAIGNYASATSNVGSTTGNVIAGNTIGALGATALAIRDASGRI